MGHTGGGDLVEIRGTGFRTWVVPPPGTGPEPSPWPTVEVQFGGQPGYPVRVISSERLYVRPPVSPVPVVKPAYGEGPVSVTVINLTPSGVPIYGERAVAANGFTYRRIQLADEPDYSRLARQVVRMLRAQVLENVSISTHTDFDIDTSDQLSVVDVASIPAIVLFGPTLRENRFYSISGPVYGPRDGLESDQYSAPDTDDLMFTITGISEQKQEALALQSAVRQFFKRNRYVYLDRDPADLSKGKVRYDMFWDPAGTPFNTPVDQKSNLKTFSGSFVIQGFDHEALPGFPSADRVGRVHALLTPVPPAPVEPEEPHEPTIPPTAVKDIVDFEFPEGTGTIVGTTITVRVPPGTDLTQLIPTVAHTGASISPPTGVVRDFTQPVDFTVTAEDGSTKVYTVTVLFSEATVAPEMQIGTNFWYHTQRNLQDSGQVNWSGEEAMVAGINWATAYGTGVNGLGTVNIWNPAWLTELQPYSVLRFMDWGNTNWAGIVSWADRMLPTSPDNVEQYSDGESAPPNPGMAYEWMIDLCNRTSKDIWICVPHMADEEYWLALANLLQSKLNSARKIYLEYSNETWNGQFDQNGWTMDQGIAMNLPPNDGSDPVGQPYYQGQAFVVAQSLRLFSYFESVFGPAAMGNRVIRVVGVGGNYSLTATALANIFTSPTYNQDNTAIDMLANAPYIGSSLDGSSPTITEDFNAEVEEMFGGGGDNFTQLKQIAETYNIASVGAYEGGQHLYTNARVWTTNPDIYDEYRHLLSRLNEAGCKLFMHYTHTGRWSTDPEGSTWGALDHTGQSTADAHKYRAIIDFLLENP